MTMDQHRVDPADEGRHPADAEQLWNESWYADFVTADGSLAGYMRWGLYPNLGVSWWTTTVVREGAPLLASVNYRLAVPDQGLSVSDGPWSVSLEPSGDLQGFRVRADAPAVWHTRAWDPFEGAAGEPAHLGMDLEWTTDGVPYHYVLTTRYEVPCTVKGELTVGNSRIPVEGQGQRDHSWGVRDWWTLSWCWMSCRLDDGTRLHSADIRIPGAPAFFGYVQRPAEGLVDPITSLAVTEDPGDLGLPLEAKVDITPGPFKLEVEPVAYGPLLLTAPDGRTSHFPRAHIRVTASDGRRGQGWIEWNLPQS
jgi:hypothetical protein